MRSNYLKGEFPEVKKSQKVNEPKHRRLKVAELMKLIQDSWDDLTDPERREYDERSSFVDHQLKKRRY